MAKVCLFFHYRGRSKWFQPEHNGIVSMKHAQSLRAGLIIAEIWHHEECTILKKVPPLKRYSMLSCFKCIYMEISQMENRTAVQQLEPLFCRKPVDDWVLRPHLGHFIISLNSCLCLCHSVPLNKSRCKELP